MQLACTVDCFDSEACCASVVLLLCRYAVYALLCGAVYVVGLPLTVLVLLHRRRHKLFGSDSDPFVATTRAKYGFLYEVGNPPLWLLFHSTMDYYSVPTVRAGSG